MRNLKFSIEDNLLVITVDLTQDFGFSKSGRSRIVASTEGNLRLFDANGFRSEIVNLSITRKASEVNGHG